MRVLIVGSYLYPAVCFGGPALVLKDLARGLKDRGLEVETIVTSANEPRDDAPRIAYVDGVKTHYAKRRRGNRWFFSFALGRAVWKALPSFDILHVHGLWLWSTAVACAAARHFRVPYVLTPHGTLDPWALSQKAIKKQLYLSLIERRNLRCAAAVHCLTHREEEEVLRLVPEADLCVIPNGVTTDCDVLTDSDRLNFRQKYPGLENRRVVLFLSRIDKKKGLDTLTAAFASLRKSAPDLHLLIAGQGDPDYVDRMKAKARVFGIEDAVTFAGLLDGKEKAAAFDIAKVFVLASKGEGMPMSVLEAMARGRPVVITPECNLSDVVEGEGAGIVVNGDAESVADGIRRILEDPKAAQMGRRGALAVHDRFGLDAVTEKLAGLFESIVEAGHAKNPTRRSSNRNER